MGDTQADDRADTGDLHADDPRRRVLIVVTAAMDNR
jgi:hypothetical protein